MSEILFWIFIFPIEKVIELFYLFISRVFDNSLISLIGVSLSINILTLPLYNSAERLQQQEREIQKHLAKKISKIKKVFSGDEQYMILSTYYKQNHYHPIYTLRGSLSLLIQVPFFIAAYSFLTNHDILQGVSCLFIPDLSLPDKLILGNFNILPVLMTIINCISCVIYAKGFPVKDKIQLYGMALIFLALLYHSPAGLVIYWTTNNIFSLLKILLRKQKYPKKIVYFTVCVFIIFLDMFLIFFHNGYILKRVIVITTVSVVFFLPIAEKFTRSLNNKIEKAWKPTETTNKSKIFFLALLSLFLLNGFVIPGALIVSSVQEFSFIDNYSSPLPFIRTLLFQSFGVFLFWPLCLYFTLAKKIKASLEVFFVFLLFFMLINAFLFPGSYGFLTNTLILSNPGVWSSNIPLCILNFAALILLGVILFFLFSRAKLKIIFSFEIITFISLLCFGAVNVFRIMTEYRSIAKLQNENGSSDNLSPVYSLSSSGRNVVIIMLDRAISGFVPEIFKQNTELNKAWDGFTFYPNCVAFSGWTLWGVPSLAGGYHYTPWNMQDNPKTLVEKTNEAILLLPRIFTENGHKAAVTDPLWANYGWSPDLSIFDPYPEIQAKNVNTSYADFWMKNHPDVEIISISTLLKERLIRFSFFKSSPLILRTFIYDRGDWLTANDRDKKENKNELTLKMISNYAVLDYLPELTTINPKTNTSLLMIFNELTHEPVFLQAPDYIPASPVTEKGTGIFSGNPHYHSNMAAFILLGKWFDFLKKNNAYDNTRIIIVSDHGYDEHIIQDSFDFSNGRPLEKYIALLMVKDFNTSGPLIIDNNFMTQADVPLLALKDIVNNPVNPFTGSSLQDEKNNGVIITTSNKFYPTMHGKHTFNIDQNEWFSVHSNIFDKNSWKKVEK